MHSPGRFQAPAKTPIINRERETFSETLAQLRQQLGVSQEKLARQLGVSFATVNRWENGYHTPSNLAKARFDAFCELALARGSNETNQTRDLPRLK